MAPKFTVEQADVLRRIGLVAGEEVRFRRADRGRWQSGRISGVERDGSITVHDSHGAARSLRPERLEVQRPGRRGRPVWIPVTEVAVTWEQLTLF
ncbi:MAG: hypothetical protein FJW09_05215 [Actinobacteria bacterium]|nr:hypothetical protein [Actinomycetota bacterium]